MMFYVKSKGFRKIIELGENLVLVENKINEIVFFNINELEVFCE